MTETTVVHEAGPTTEEGQFCRRCGVTLVRTCYCGWPVGAKVITSGPISMRCADIVPADCKKTFGEDLED